MFGNVKKIVGYNLAMFYEFCIATYGYDKNFDTFCAEYRDFLKTQNSKIKEKN